MLFRPSFCCKCGERIEREEWRLWTSRRLCPLCATEHTLQEFVPRAVVGLAAIVLTVGTVNYLFGGRSRKELALTRAPVMAQTVDQTRSVASSVQQQVPVVPPVAANSSLATGPTATVPRTIASAAQQNPPPAVTTEISPPTYYCGAETKKGTPCSRKVKGNVRCWQHTGMPAMLSPDKLLVSR